MKSVYLSLLTTSALLPSICSGALISTWTAPQDAGSLGDAGSSSVLLTPDPVVNDTSANPFQFTSSVSTGTDYTDVIVLSASQQAQLSSVGLSVTQGLNNVRGATRRLNSGSFESLGNIGGGPPNVTQRDATFDLFLSPDNLNDVSQLIFETGGSGAGSSLHMNGSVMTLGVATNATLASNTTIDLAGIYGGAPDTDNMLQVRFSIDLTNDLITLSALNLATGLGAANSTSFTGGDWAGSDGTGLFNFNGTAGGSAGNNVPAGYSNFDGQFGGLRFYSSEVLGTVPEPSSSFLMILALGCLTGVRSRKRA